MLREMLFIFRQIFKWIARK